MSLSAQVSDWQSSSARAKTGVVKVNAIDEGAMQLKLTVGGHPLVLTCPADSDSLFDVETDAAALAGWHATIATYCFEQEDVTLPQLLDKMSAVWEKANPGAAAAAAATPAAASSSSSSASAVSASAIPPVQRQASKAKDAFDDDGMDDDPAAGADDDEGEEGWGGGGDEAAGDGWGDFKEANADEEIHDEKWNATKALKKRLLSKAEALRESQQHATEVQRQANAAKGIKSIFSSDAAVTMLVNDCMSYMQTPQPGISVKCVDDNVFVWQVKLSEFPPESQIHKDLKQLQSIYNYSYVEVEIRFMMDLYPFFPPSVRLVRPRMKNFLIGRLVCMPEIQLNQWNPTRTVGDILGCIRRVLTTFGEVDSSEPEVNDPDSENQPYTALEFELLRLTMLTDILPRVVKTMGDPEAIKLIVPKSKPKAEKDAEKAAAAAAAAAPAAQPYYDGYGQRGGPGTGFRRGTGYGGGHTTSSGWDIDQWKAAQQKKESEVCEIAHSLALEMGKAVVPPSLATVLEQSCLLPFLIQYVQNDSISDMESHSIIYRDILEIIRAMASHPNLIRLFELLPGESKSLSSYLADMRAQAAIAIKFEKFATNAPADAAAQAAASTAASMSAMASATAYGAGHVNKKSKNPNPTIVDTNPKSLLVHILEVCDAVDAALAIYRSQKDQMDSATGGGAVAPSSSTAAAAASSAASSSSAASPSSAVDYVQIMSPYRFGEVEKFQAHHYMKTYGASSSALSRAWVKRLGVEYSDLSKSLPINPCSSVFLRYKEDQMAFCQFLIAAPDETPYGFGLFLFDAYFPNTYPAGPPLVNLQTTGGGSIRFNPNLYNCGKVCLSLLGTWRQGNSGHAGAAGENWSAATSTFLQVCVSIQSLILVPEPYFNEPGYQSTMGTAHGKTQSDAYNRVIEVGTIKFAMIDQMKKPPDWAKDIVRSHFCLHRLNIMKQCTGWAEHNPEVKKLLPQLEELLLQQSLPDGSKPVLPLVASQGGSASPASSSSATTSPASAKAAAAGAGAGSPASK